MATTTTETTHGLTYPVARVIEVTAICRCRLLLLSVSLTIPVTGLRSLLATAMGVTGSACQYIWLECFHLSMPSPYDL